MNWLFQLQATQPVAHAVGVLALACFAGMALGSVKFRGVGLGTAGVLFGTVAAPLAGWPAGFDPAASLGIFSGASANMPSLGAATQTLGTLPNIAPGRLALPALALTLMQ